MRHLTIEEISAALDRALTGPAAEKARAHLSACVLCKDQQARFELHDDALRRLFAQTPEDRALEELGRRSKAIAVAIVQELPVPPLVTSTPLLDDDATPRWAPPAPAPESVERLARFSPPASHGPATVEQDPTATPASAARELPPPREASRGMRRLEKGPEDASAPLDVTPRLDTERSPGSKAGGGPGSLVESYDAFNDQAYAGPAAGRLPPMIGRPAEKKEGDSEPQPARREYRHGGVRRDAGPPADRAGEKPARRPERPESADREEGFGVRRGQEPAWSRLGLQPDPTSPGVYRDPLTGAAVSPPPVNARRGSGSGRSGSRRSRAPLIAALATVGGLLAVAYALRIPTGARLSVQFGRPGADAPAAPAGSLQVHDATTRPPVDVAVPPAAGAATGTSGPAVLEDPRVCGQVMDVNGRPVPGALLTVAGTMAQTRSDAAGRFCLTAPAGTRVVEVVDPRGTGTATRNIRIEFVAGAPAARVVLP